MHGCFGTGPWIRPVDQANRSGRSIRAGRRAPKRARDTPPAPCRVLAHSQRLRSATGHGRRAAGVSSPSPVDRPIGRPRAIVIRSSRRSSRAGVRSCRRQRRVTPSMASGPSRTRRSCGSRRAHSPMTALRPSYELSPPHSGQRDGPGPSPVRPNRCPHRTHTGVPRSRIARRTKGA